MNFKKIILIVSLIIYFSICNYSYIYSANDQFNQNDVPNISNKFQSIQKKSKDKIDNKLRLTSEEKEWIKNNKEVTVAMMNQYPPFSFKTEGGMRGFSVDIFNLLTEKTGLKFKIINDSWSENLEKFKNREVDVIDGISYKQGRTPFTLYTSPYYVIPTVIYVRKKDNWYKSLKDLSGRKVGITKDLFCESKLRKIKNIKVIEKEKNEKLMKLLSFGKIDAVITNLAVGNFYIRKNMLNNLKVVDEYEGKRIKKEDLRIGIRKDKPILRNIIQKGLNALSKQKLMNLKNIWFGISRDSRPDSSKIKLTKREQEFIKNHPVIRVSNETDWPPFDFAVSGQPLGFSIDLMNLLANRLGIKFEYVNGYSWNQLMEMFKNREIDVMQSAYKNEARKKYGLFTEPYYKDKTAFIVRSDSREIFNIQQLYGKVVAVPKGWAYETYLKKHHSQVNLLTVSNQKEALKAVEKGRAKAAIEISAIAKYFMEKYFLDGLKISGWFKEYDKREQKSVHILVRKDWPVLHGMLEKALATVTPREIKKLEEKWLGRKNYKGLQHINLTSEEREFLNNHSVIRVANEKDWPPFDFMKNGQPKGFAIDYLKLLGDMIGIKFKFINGYSWSELLEKAKRKEVDLFPVLWKSEQREKYLEFTDSYAELIKVLVTRKQSKVRGLTDLKGKKIALSKGYALTNAVINEYPEYEYVLVENPKEGLKKLSFGEVDGFIGSSRVVNYITKQRFIDNLQIVEEIKLKNNLSLYMGVRKDWTILRDIINKAMDKVSSSHYNKLVEKWVKSSHLSEKNLNLMPKEKKYLRNKEEISICIKPNWMPFEGIDSKGNYQGILARFYDLISEKIGVPIKLVKTDSWKESLFRVRNDQCDIISTVVKTKEKADYLNFTAPYAKYPLVIVTGKEEIYINNLKSVKDKKIGIAKNSVFFDIIKEKYPEINLIKVKNTNDGLEKVQADELFGFIDTAPAVGYIIQQRKMFDLKISGELDSKLSLRIGVRDDDKMLLNILDKIVRSLKKEEKKKLFQNWMTIEYEKGFNYSLFKKIVLGIIIVVSFILYRNYQLSKFNRRLTDLNTELAEANKKLKDMSFVDGLTQIPNRRRFDEVLKKEWKRSLREKSSLSLIMVDLDCFKEFNDTYGHLAGDDCLKKVAKSLSEAVKRPTDFVARYGGEEFVVILPDTDKKGAKKVSEKLRKEIESLKILHANSQISDCVTVSLGTVTTVPTVELSREKFVDAADKALYQAKQEGRNQVKSIEI
ncbi:transporter substrate-binding domain-containing protein [Sporohalobacter salinus]|uniref:transporter substrate-binding domain-containing diguanylate cyclase n=1 Tax=Sporohalobacter salinus TaxID=1494606 RepID=UPI001961A9CE|nr:transporter substrate-binding domain-containing protein [Sporohalobacter salinus]MBM7622483.1 diguanylate cyclase (GGDEF)-like protein [Sporohalobacter salinus]